MLFDLLGPVLPPTLACVYGRVPYPMSPCRLSPSYFQLTLPVTLWVIVFDFRPAGAGETTRVADRPTICIRIASRNPPRVGAR